MPRIALLALSLAFAACGDDLESETLIGATCEETEDCGVEGVCITSGRDGMCSRACEDPGALMQCPLDTFCDSMNVETAEDTLSDMTLCLPACTQTTDCRTGYECTGVSGGSGRVCQPEN
jgi:hypothetical protein